MEQFISKLPYKSERLNVMGNKNKEAKQQEKSRYYELHRVSREQPRGTATELMQLPFKRDSCKSTVNV